MLTIFIPSLLFDLNGYNDNSSSAVMVYGEDFHERKSFERLL